MPQARWPAAAQPPARRVQLIPPAYVMLQFLEIGATRHHDHELPGTGGGAAAAAREAAAAQAAAGGAGQQQVVRQQGGAAAGREQRQEQQKKKTQPKAVQEQQQQQQPQQKAGGWPTTGDTIHTLFTSNGERSPCSSDHSAGGCDVAAHAQTPAGTDSLEALPCELRSTA